MPDPERELRPRGKVAVLLVALAAIVVTYWPALSAEWLSGDRARIPHGESAAEPHAVLDMDAPEEAPSAARAAPLPRAVLAATHGIVGFDPRGYRVIAIAIHALTALLVGAIARRWLHDARAALAATLVFALHPVQAPVVATLDGLDASLALLFVLVALHAAWRARDSRRPVLLVAIAVAAWVLALACERSALVAPILALAALRVEYPTPRATQRARAVLAGASAVALVLLFALPSGAADEIGAQAGFARRALLRVEILGGVIRDLAWPPSARIFAAYRPDLRAGDPSLVGAWIALGALAIAAAWAWKRRAHRFLAATLFVPIALLPALVRAQELTPFPLSGAVHLGASVGFALCVATFVSALARWSGIALVACALPLCLGFATARRLDAWRDERTLYVRAVEETPDSPRLRWRQGRALLSAYRASGERHDLALAGGAFHSALDLLERVQRGDRSVFATSDDFLQSNLGLGWTLLHEAEAERYLRDETALTVFQKIVDRYPGSSEAQVGLGVAASALGRTDEAQEALEKAIAIDDRPAETWHDLGLVRARRGNWKGAEEAFERALARRPDHVDDLLLVARMRVLAGEPARAAEPIARAARVDPKNPGPHRLRATVAAAGGRFDEALDDVRRALELAPQDGESWLLKGKIHLARGEENAAFTALTRAVDFLPASFEANYDLAALHLKRREIAAALPKLERAYAVRPAGAAADALRETLLEIQPQDPDFIALLAETDVRRGMDESAEEWLARALAIRPEHGPSHLLRSRVLQRRGDTDAAIEALERACRAMPDDFGAEFELGTLLAERGRGAEARAHFERALALATRDQSLESHSAARAVRERLDALDAEGQ